MAKDSSGKGNDLSLISAPTRHDTDIRSGGNSLRTGMLSFKNNVAVNKAVKGMPEKDFTVEFWAKGAKLDDDKPELQVRWLALLRVACLACVVDWSSSGKAPPQQAKVGAGCWVCMSVIAASMGSSCNAYKPVKN